MRKLLTKGIFIAAGLEFLVKYAIFLSYEISRKPKFDEPRMDCLGGLQYVVFIIIAILAVLISLPAYLNLYPKVRNSKWLSFLTFFALHLLYFVCCLPLMWQKYSSVLNFLVFTPCIYWIVWIITYWRIRKNIKLGIK